MKVTKSFDDLKIDPVLLSAITELGYKTPTLVQEHSIPSLIEGRDLLVQAQTGTGKTAAFTLPILSNLDINIASPQALVIVPTRELAVQVAESFKGYAKFLKGFHVLPIYGGESYQTQLRALKRGVQVIVGTPGRLMDHFRRGVIPISALKTVVLDEADEMLNMGFIKDIEWILNQISHKYQVALFSATMPESIKKIASRYLKDAKKIQIKPEKNTVNNIEQYYMSIPYSQKLQTLTHFLETEDVKAAIVFVRTKNASSEIAEQLQAQGYAVAALNGDVKQSLRKRIIDQIKGGSLDIIVATDLAARGIDVERVSHVVNFDIPHDTESYIHRIGRTGRAGRKGKALLFVTPKERRLLNDIKKATHSPVIEISPPSRKEVEGKRLGHFSKRITDVIKKSSELKPYYQMVDNIVQENGCSLEDVAAALTYLNQQPKSKPANTFKDNEQKQGRGRDRNERFKGKSFKKPHSKNTTSKKFKGFSKKRKIKKVA